MNGDGEVQEGAAGPDASQRHDAAALLALGLSADSEAGVAESLPADPRASIRPRISDALAATVNVSQLPELSFSEGPESAVSTRSAAKFPDAGRAPSEASPVQSYAFVLGRIIGKGGMGEVREARQVSLGRMVAVKRPTLPDGASEEAASEGLDLFAREAVVTARLEHPNVVPVHDLEQGSDGLPILAMKMVQGTRWPDLLDADRDQPVRERLVRHLPILIDVAQAVAFAHERGIIHRDLKPGQVMVGRHGEVYLMDWGLAVSFERGDFPAESTTEETGLAAMATTTAPNPAGTPAYMAPEQTERSAVRLGPWTDVWLLGAVLYEILTGTPPYAQKRSLEAFGAAARGAVEPPGVRVDPERGAEIPDELTGICMKCLSPGIGDRLASAEVFVTRIKDYLSGASRREESRQLVTEAVCQLDEVSANPSLGYEALEECDRKLSRALTLDPDNRDATVARQRAVEALARVALGGGDLRLARLQAGRLTDEARRADLLRQIGWAEARARRLRAQRFGAVVLAGLLAVAVAAVTLISRQRIVSALVQVENSEREAQGQRAKAETAATAARQSEQQVRGLQEQAVYELYLAKIGIAQTQIKDEEFGRAQAALLECPEKHRSWEWGYLMARAHPELMTYSGHAASVTSVAFAPDGERLATAAKDGTIRLWNVWSGRELLNFRDPAGTTRRVRWSSNSRALLTVTEDGTAALWTTPGAAPRRLGSLGSPVVDAQFGDGGTSVATLTRRGTVEVFEAATGRMLRSYPTDVRPASALDLSPDGRYAAIVCGKNGVGLLDLQQGTIVSRGTPAIRADMVRFSPSGRMLLTCFSTFARFSLFSVPDLNQVGRFELDGFPSDPRWAPSGTKVLLPISTSFRGYAAWQVPDDWVPGARRAPFASRVAKLSETSTGIDATALDVTSDGRLCAVGTVDGQVRLYSEGGRAAPGPDFSRGSGSNFAAWNSASQELCVGSLDSNLLWFWNRQDDRLVLQARAPSNLFALSYTPDGSRVLCATTSGFALCNPASGECQPWPSGAASAPVRQFSYAPDASALAGVRLDGPTTKTLLDLWSPTKGGLFKTVDPSLAPSPSICAFSRDSGRMAVGGYYGEVAVFEKPWDAPAWRASLGGEVVRSVAFHPDGRSLAATEGTKLYLLDVGGGQVLRTLDGHVSLIIHVAYSPDGARLASAALDGQLGIWDAANGRNICFLNPDGRRIFKTAWSPDGLAIATPEAESRHVPVYEAVPWVNAGAVQPGAIADAVTTATWPEHLRAWQAAQLHRGERKHALSPLPDSYWTLDRLARGGVAAADSRGETTETRTLLAALTRGASPTAELAASLKGAEESLDRFSRSRSSAPVLSVAQLWEPLRDGVERAFLAGRTRGQVEADLDRRFEQPSPR